MNYLCHVQAIMVCFLMHNLWNHFREIVGKLLYYWVEAQQIPNSRLIIHSTIPSSAPPILRALTGLIDFSPVIILLRINGQLTARSVWKVGVKLSAKYCSFISAHISMVVSKASSRKYEWSRGGMCARRLASSIIPPKPPFPLRHPSWRLPIHNISDPSSPSVIPNTG